MERVGTCVDECHVRVGVDACGPLALRRRGGPARRLEVKLQPAVAEGGRAVREEGGGARNARVVAAEAAGAELGGGNSVGAYLLQYVRASEAPRLGLRGGAAEL